jgi:hypothetical protein
MSEGIRRLIETVPNPFVHVRVDSAWESLAIDVPSINDAAFRECQRLVEDVRNTSQSHGLLLDGQPGAGKTHLLTRLRHWLLEERRGRFVYVFPISGPERFYRDVLHALAGDMLRQAPEGHGLGQMEIAIAQHLLGSKPATLDAIAHWWDQAQARHPASLLLFDFLRQSLSPLVEDLQLSEAVVSVVLQFIARLHRADARAWLVGRPVTEEQSAALGVAGTLDDETLAADALITFIRLLGLHSTVILAFDQIEGLRVGRDDTATLVSWANGIANLLAQTQNLGVVTCALNAFVNDLQSAVGDALFYGRIAERGASLAPLTPAEALTLVVRRLKRSDDIQTLRLALRARGAMTISDDEFWPLRKDEIEGLARQPDISTRSLLLGCRRLFDERRSAWIGTAAGVPGGALLPPRETLDDVVERAMTEERSRAVDKIDEGAYVDGLLRVIDLLGSPGLSASRSRSKDVDLVLERGRQRLGVAVCHAESMTSLAARLKRLLDKQRQGEFARLVLIRDQRLPISTRAKATQAHIEELARAGSVVVRPSAEVYAALSAIRQLLGEAAAGDLTVDGKGVAPEELKTWLARQLPTCVSDFIDEMARGSPPAATGDVERLQWALRESWLMELEAAAQAAQLPVEWTRTLAERHPGIVGHIDGTPELLFLHPDAMDRS